MATEIAGRLAADRCPFSRDFVPGFRDCAAYMPEEYTAFDTGYHPLRPVVTCRHLTVGTESGGGYYPRCGLGKEAERERWASGVGSEWLEEFRALSLEYRKWVAGLMPRVWESKGKLLAARELGRPAPAESAELKCRVDELLAAASAWTDEHADRLRSAGIEPEVFKSLVAAATADWADSSNGGLHYQVPDRVLEKFPERVRVFIRAGR